MTTQLFATRAGAAVGTWEITLDAELPPASCSVDAERARAVADRMARIPSVRSASVRPHCQGRFVLADLVIEAGDLSDALDRAAVFLRSCATDAGAGPLILVAARYSASVGR